MSRYNPLQNEMLTTSYPSPEELTQSVWENEAMFGSLLFKLGMTIVEVWGVYGEIISQISDLENDKNVKAVSYKSLKEVVYSKDVELTQSQDRNNRNTKIDWLQVA